MGIRGSLEPYHGICARFFGREEAGLFFSVVACVSCLIPLNDILVNVSHWHSEKQSQSCCVG